MHPRHLVLGALYRNIETGQTFRYNGSDFFHWFSLADKGTVWPNNQHFNENEILKLEEVKEMNYDN